MGFDVGSKVGPRVGSKVGDADGSSVGRFDGSCVGSKVRFQYLIVLLLVKRVNE